MRAESIAALLTLAGCIIAPAHAGGEAAPATDLEPVIRDSYRTRGQATLDRLQQTEMQRICSTLSPEAPAADAQQRLQTEAMASVRLPQDSRWLGDWQRGEKIAQSGTGMQYSDPPDAPHGGGCYGCHQLSGTEIAYGTIGPSLYRYAERKGSGEEAMRRAWTQIWNPHAFNACSMMPRFGDAGILSPDQIRDLMALLFDGASPVNR